MVVASPAGCARSGQRRCSGPQKLLVTHSSKLSARRRLCAAQVQEMLLYTAELKRPVSESRADKAAVVDMYLDKLNLERCKDVKIGNSLSRCASICAVSLRDARVWAR